MTPLIKIDNLYFKREDLNPTGSVKDRALPFQIANLKSLSFSKAVISSTGNAAISAQYYCQLHHIELKIFVSSHINSQKLALLSNYQISSKPISDAFKYSQFTQSYLLRQSTDPSALDGYRQIGVEIIKELPQITSIFIPVGSGTTLLGISQSLPKNIKIFAVQPANYHPIAINFDQNFLKEDSSLTDALGVKLLPLKNQVLKAISDSSGSGLIIQNKDIEKSLNFFQDHQIHTSAEGAMALSAVAKAKQLFDIGSFPVVLLTGVKR